MTFRFSLKWLLAAMAYVAFVLAALVQSSALWSNLLWLVNGVVVLVLLLVAIFCRGQPRAIAVGFVLFMAASEAAERWSPERSPTNLVKAMFRLGGSELESERNSLNVRLDDLERQYFYYANNGDTLDQSRVQQEQAKLAKRRDKLSQRLGLGSSLEPVIAMACGLLGAIAASIVWRRGQGQQPATGSVTVK